MIPDKLFVLIQHFLPKLWISSIIGKLADLRKKQFTERAIRLFVFIFKVELKEAEMTNPADYKSFNDFFTRKLQANARPQPASPNEIAMPADGTISQIGILEGKNLLQAKGKYYSVLELLGNDTLLSEKFEGGGFCTIYLAPNNYHRVHQPITGKPRWLHYCPGALYSVNSATTRRLPNLFCVNERVAVIYQHPWGYSALVMVGALNVGSINLSIDNNEWLANRPVASITPSKTRVLDASVVQRGEEVGFFKMGSTVIFLLSKGSWGWKENLVAGVNVKVGQTLATQDV